MEMNKCLNHIRRNSSQRIWNPSDLVGVVSDPKGCLHGLYERGDLCAFGPLRDIGRDGYELRTER